MPHLRTFHPRGRGFVCLFFRFSALLFLPASNLTLDCFDQKHPQHEGFRGLDWRMQRPICSKRGGAVCDRGKHQKTIFFVVLL